MSVAVLVSSVLVVDAVVTGTAVRVGRVGHVDLVTRLVGVSGDKGQCTPATMNTW